MYNHNIRFCIPVILCSSWLLATSAKAAPAPAQHAAGMVHTPLETDEDAIAHFAQMDPVEDSKAMVQDLHNSYSTEVNMHLGDGCTEDKMIVRKEWGDLTEDERRTYIAACHCLRDKPSQTPPDVAPGARTRWDDFVVAHILHTDDVHRSPWLLYFHTEFLFQFEKALRDECELPFGQPYWDYGRYTDRPMEEWPMFDGSDTSLGGNGKPDTPSPDCNCVTDGPFADWKVNLGPAAGNHACTPNPQDDGLGFNERCLERKWRPDLLQNLTYDNMQHSIMNMQSPDEFGTYIESWPIGLHAIPHVLVGGTQSDVPASPSDAIFLCHHTGLDWMWRMWIYLDFDARTTQLPKAEAYDDLRKKSRSPPAPPIDMDSDIQLSPIFEPVKVRDVINPTGGRYCYRYE